MECYYVPEGVSMLKVMWYSSPLETLTDRDSFEEENEEEEKAPQPIPSLLSSAKLWKCQSKHNYAVKFLTNNINWYSIDEICHSVDSIKGTGAFNEHSKLDKGRQTALQYRGGL